MQKVPTEIMFGFVLLYFPPLVFFVIKYAFRNLQNKVLIFLSSPLLSKSNIEGNG